MSSEEAAFLRSICENPLDDTVRLVYADWLEEHGQEERAEFIRVQIALSKCPPKHKTLTHGRDLGLSVTDRGDGYYTVTALEGYECNVGDRVDVLCHTSYRKKPVWMYGLRVCRFINQESEFNGEVVLKKDEHSKPWEGTELEKREKELEPLLTSRLSAPCPGCGGKGLEPDERPPHPDRVPEVCRTCGGARDLFRNGVLAGLRSPRPHHFDRGCLYLDVAMGEVAVEADVPCPHCEGDGKHRHLTVIGNGTKILTRATVACRWCDGTSTVRGWQPTPWAAALPPKVVGLWVTDREPQKWSATSYTWSGMSELEESWHVPCAVYDLIGPKEHPTPHLANLHLAHALRQWIYECVSRDSTAT